MQNRLMQDTQSKYCRYEKTCPLKTDRCKVWYMNSTAKVLIPNKEWLVKDGKRKIGSVSKAKKGYWFIKNGKHIELILIEMMPLEHLSKLWLNNYSVFG